VGSNPTLSANKKGLSFRPFFIGGAGCVDEPTGFDKNRGVIFGRRGPAAAVRSEAEDERPSPAASNPTLSANKRACLSGPFYWLCRMCGETKLMLEHVESEAVRSS
jgi:hypothetical protein